jgi:hypothetical protein
MLKVGNLSLHEKGYEGIKTPEYYHKQDTIPSNIPTNTLQNRLVGYLLYFIVPFPLHNYRPKLILRIRLLLFTHLTQ